MTGGKTRQKRNGPGGSGCFHAFCYFLVRPARTLRGGDRPAQAWCTNPRKTLFLRFPCTKSERLFGVRPVRTWCTNPRKTLFLRFPCTKSGCLFGERPAQAWCTIPRKTLFLRFLCTKSGCLFGDRPAQAWCTIPRKTLFLRFPCTKSERLFGERPAQAWCTIPRKTLFLRFLCTKSGCLFGDRPSSSHKNTLPQKEGVFELVWRVNPAASGFRFQSEAELGSLSHATRFPDRCLVRQPGGAHRFPSSAPTR